MSELSDKDSALHSLGYERGYAAGYRAAQAEAGIKPGPLDQQCECPPEGHHARCQHDRLWHAASAATDGPAADPIADLCAELRATHCSNENLHDNAAYELERLARTERLLQACVRHETARAERAEAERDAAKEELQYVMDDWNAIVRASGSPTNGGAVGYVAALCAERDALRECVRAADGLRAECDQVRQWYSSGMCCTPTTPPARR